MKRSSKLLLIFTIVGITLVLASCSSENSDQDFGNDGGEYDVEFMATEYPEQLLRDGANTVIGTVEITGSGDDFSVTVDQKKVVANDNYEDGYYIADRNITQTYPLGSDLGILVEEENGLAVCTAEEFMEDKAGDTDSLYTIYLIGDVVELIQPLDPASAARK